MARLLFISATSFGLLDTMALLLLPSILSFSSSWRRCRAISSLSLLMFSSCWPIIAWPWACRAIIFWLSAPLSLSSSLFSHCSSCEILALNFISISLIFLSASSAALLAASSLAVLAFFISASRVFLSAMSKSSPKTKSNSLLAMAKSCLAFSFSIFLLSAYSLAALAFSLLTNSAAWASILASMSSPKWSMGPEYFSSL
mmetsp:Transcript_18455/g.34245  ORF Transcript_18455/g.34245 Transcript_18455/m.34245 type:complete len:200 (-) Transcript_18455:1063-1662(-)